MSIVTVNSRLIHYEVLGRGQPLLFVHGWLGSWRYWWPTMQALSAGQRSFAIDLWGFGDSSKIPSLYALSAYVEMVDEFIDKMGIAQPLIMVGHALGAAVALRYAQQKPDNVSKLVMVSLPVEGNFIHNRLANSAPDSFVSRVLGKSNSFSEVDSELKKTDPQAMNRLAQELRNIDFLDELSEFQKPSLIVSGNQDQVIQLPEHEHDNLHNANDRQFFVPLDQCNHFPMLQQKVKFNRLMLDFIHADDSVTELTPKDHWQRRVR
ncbi:MAG: alpha/beta hydrolase [Chloroflexi bacterium]|nr:alpha/beta hydrolase [Chloroflexota bacterium]